MKFQSDHYKDNYNSLSLDMDFYDCHCATHFIVLYQHVRIFISYVLKCDSIVSLEFKQTIHYAGAKTPACLLFAYMFKFRCLTCSISFPYLVVGILLIDFQYNY